MGDGTQSEMIFKICNFFYLFSGHWEFLIPMIPIFNHSCTILQFRIKILILMELEQESVEWNHFLEAFIDMLRKANEFQLREYSERSHQHQYIVREELSRRKVAMIPPQVAELKLNCLKNILGLFLIHPLLLCSHLADFHASVQSKGWDDQNEEFVSMEHFGQNLVWFGPMVDLRTRKIILLDTIYEILSKPLEFPFLLYFYCKSNHSFPSA